MKRLLLAGSGSNHLWRYCNMISDGFDEVVIVTNQRPKEILDKVTKIVMVDFSLHNPIAFIRGILKIRKQIKDLKPDLIHIQQANTAATAVILAAEKSGIPVILTALGSDVLSIPDQGPLYRHMVRYNISRADVCTSDSLYMAKAMDALAGRKRLKIVIANLGIGVEPKMGVKKENIIYSNRMHGKLYRIDKIIDYFHEFMRTAKEDWRLVIAGQGPETGWLKRKVQGLGLRDRVDFVGLLGSDENGDFYNRARIFMSVPRNDATSVSLLEAMACGCIPVVSNLPANLEWITNGINGKVVNEEEVGVINQALLIDPVAAANINRDIISKKATIAVNKKIFAGIYTDLLEAKRAG